MLVFIIKNIPQNFISWLTGALTRCQFPDFLKPFIHTLFVRATGIDMTEAQKPLDEYKTIEDIFTRALKPGFRPVQADVCSPADGQMIWSKAVNSESEALQVKGKTLSLHQLVFGADSTETVLNPGWYTTIYLAPHNYHRVHSPFSGIINSIRHIPGKLWPVNSRFTALVPDLFIENERLVFEISVENKPGKAWLVMVGALNVGRITTPFWHNFISNNWVSDKNRRQKECRQISLSAPVQAGDEIGTFMLGSTVIIVYDKALSDILKLSEVQKPSAIRVGQSLLKTSGDQSGFPSKGHIIDCSETPD